MTGDEIRQVKQEPDTTLNYYVFQINDFVSQCASV